MSDIHVYFGLWRERERERKLTTNGGEIVGTIVDDIIEIHDKTLKPI